MRKRTPHEKKELSYERDRRNVYGESPHAGRKAIPLRKALRNRANRRLANQELAIQGPTPSDDISDAVESGINQKAPKNWNKTPDAPLGKVLAEKSRRRKIMRENGGRDALVTRITLNTEENS